MKLRFSKHVISNEIFFIIYSQRILFLITALNFKRFSLLFKKQILLLIGNWIGTRRTIHCIGRLLCQCLGNKCGKRIPRRNAKIPHQKRGHWNIRNQSGNKKKTYEFHLFAKEKMLTLSWLQAPSRKPPAWQVLLQASKPMSHLEGNNFLMSSHLMLFSLHQHPPSSSHIPEV